MFIKFYSIKHKNSTYWRISVMFHTKVICMTKEKRKYNILTIYFHNEKKYYEESTTFSKKLLKH